MKSINTSKTKESQTSNDDPLEGPVENVEEKVKSLKQFQLGSHVSRVHNLDIKLFDPSKTKKKNFHYLLYGFVGDGKSSLLNTLATVMHESQTYVRLAETSPLPFAVQASITRPLLPTTTLEMYYHNLFTTASGSSHLVCDTRGITHFDFNELHHLLQGKCHTDILPRIGDPVIQRIRVPKKFENETMYVDCVILVVSVQRILKGDESILQVMKVYNALKQLGFGNQRMIVLTHWDKVEEDQKDLSKWAIKLGVDVCDLIPISNYISKDVNAVWQRDDEIDKMAVKCVMEMVKRGEESLTRVYVNEDERASVRFLLKRAKDPTLIALLLAIIAILLFLKIISTSHERY